MLYVPSPYSSGTDVSVCEQDKYSVSTPPSPPCGLATSDAYNNKETSDYNTHHESPPLTPKQLLDSEEPLNDQPTSATKDGDEDEFFFLGQLQNDTTTAQQQQEQVENGDYLLYDNGYEETDYHQYHHQHPDQGTCIFEPFDKSLYSNPSMTNDDFETATRAFHATINKFSRQNYPDHRKRTPYNFLENWHLHSMYSKSQQILLGIPHVRPMVLLSGDDFMFTPPLLQQEEEEEYMDDQHTDHQLGYLDQSMQMEWIDDGQMFEDDGEILDDGIVIMSAPDPPLMMTPSTTMTTTATTTTPLPLSSTAVLNENAWMKNQLDFPSPQYHHHHLDHHHHHHHMNDEDEEGDQQYQLQQHEGDGASTSTSAMVSTSDRDPFYFASGLTSELLHWYRTSDRGRPPSTIMENRDSKQDDIDEQVTVDMDDSNDMDVHQPPVLATTTTSTSDLLLTEEKQSTIVNNHGSPTSYQSLADMVPCSSTAASSPMVATVQPCRSTTITTQESPQQYGATHVQQHSSTTTPTTSRWFHHHHQQQHSGLTDQLVATSDLVLTMASDYRLEGKNTTVSFIACMIRIWKILFLTAELMLAGLWGQQQQPLVTSTKSRKTAAGSILPF